MQQTKINIAFICDDGYAMPTGVAITSLLANKHEDSHYSVYIITSGLSEENMARLKGMATPTAEIHIVDVPDTGKYDYLRKPGFAVTPTAIFKFELPSLLPDLDRVLYMDGDIIIQKDLSEVYSTDLTGCYAGVVKDYRGMTLHGDFRKRLDINHTAYFNSGVMLLNLVKLREDDMTQHLLYYRANSNNFYMDQDALNVVFAEKVKYLSYLYNMQTTSWRFFPISDLTRFYGLPLVNDRYELVHQAAVVHYTAEKPWNYFDVCCSELWLHYFLLSPFCQDGRHRRSVVDDQLEESKFKRVYQNRVNTPADFGFKPSDTPKISVVMPVYRAEAFLTNALASLQRQSLMDFEVLCVDDCSPDGSLTILRRYEAADPRFRCIAAPVNGGAGAARNLALDNARGEYVTFLDADDELPANALELYYLTAKSTGADYLIAQTYAVNHALRTSLRLDLLPNKEAFAPQEVADHLLSITHGGPSGKCIRRELLEKLNLRFPKLSRSEDFYLLHAALASASLIAPIAEPLYIVNPDANQQSLEHTKDKDPRAFYEGIVLLKKFFEDQGIYDLYRRTFINSNLVRYYYNLGNMHTMEGYGEVFDILQGPLRELFELDQHPEEYFYEKHEYRKLLSFMAATPSETLMWRIREQDAELKVLREKAHGSVVISGRDGDFLAQLEKAEKRGYHKGVSATHKTPTFKIGSAIMFVPHAVKMHLKKLTSRK